MAQKHFIIGGHGFVGGAIGAELENRRKSCKFISRNDIDLAASDCPAYIKSSINDPDISLKDVFYGAFPFAVIMLLVLILIIAFPVLSTGILR